MDYTRLSRALSSRAVIVALALLGFAFSAGVGYSQVGGGFDLSWSTIDGGGGTFSTGSSFELGGTVGQPDAGAMSGGGFGLQGGFWGAAAPQATPDGVIVGRVIWEGIPQPDSHNAEIPATLSLCVSGNPVTYDTNTDSSGYFTVTTGLAGGVYNWSLKGQMHLANSGTLALEPSNPSTGAPDVDSQAKASNVQTTHIAMGLMRAGDANDDNVVEALDFNMLKLSFGTAVGDPQYNPQTDFNRDGTVEVLDFTLLKGNFGEAGTPLTCP